jgi:hypothetical protein
MIGSTAAPPLAPEDVPRRFRSISLDRPFSGKSFVPTENWYLTIYHSGLA